MRARKSCERNWRRRRRSRRRRRCGEIRDECIINDFGSRRTTKRGCLFLCFLRVFFFFISFSNLLRSPPTTSSLDDFSCKGFIFQLFSPSRSVGILYKTVFSSFPNPTFIQSRLSTPVNRLPCIFNSRIMHQHSPRTISIVARLLSCTLCSSTTRRSIRWYSRPCTVNTCVY